MTSQNTHKPKILLVEDNEGNVMVATILLDNFGLAYDVAYNGHEAVNKATNERYNAILMDVSMSGMCGLEATRSIRAYEEQNGIPRTSIIGMTAHALRGDREKCLEAGMDDYIAKPYKPQDLQEKLHKFLNHSNGAAA